MKQSESIKPISYLKSTTSAAIKEIREKKGDRGYYPKWRCKSDCSGHSRIRENERHSGPFENAVHDF